MNLHALRLAALLLVILGASAARAEFTAQDRIRSLYSPMFAFNEDNIPILRIGVATGREQVRLTTRGPVRLYSAEKGGLEWRLDRKTTIDISWLHGEPAVARYWVVVEQMKPGGFEALRARTETWGKLGYTVKPIELGRVFGYFGKMFDNRRVELVIDRALATQEEAEALITELSAHTPSDYRIRTTLGELPSGEMEVRVKGVAGVFRTTSVVWVEPQDDGGITVSDVTFGRGFAWGYTEDVRYDGSVYVTFDRDGKLAVTNVADAETVLKGVVAGEIFASAPADALKAQAVTARGEMLSKIGLRHDADPFHICSDVHCQAYKGASKRTRSIDAAVDATIGEMLFYGGALVNAFYHSDSGGYTEANENAWMDQEPRPSLRCVADMPEVPAGYEDGIPADRIKEWIDHPPRTWTSDLRYAKNTFRWERVIPHVELLARLAEATGSPKTGRLDGLEVVRRGCSGRAIEVRFTVSGTPYTVEGELTLRKLIGGKRALRSSMFYAQDDGKALTVRGGGFGHGVGMSQMAAMGRAKAGQTYREILKAYYLGSAIEKVY